MVKVDKTACIGCGACVSICPASFEMGSDGKASAKAASNCAEAAKSACPVSAIK